MDRGDVLAILTPIWTTKPEIARKLRQRMRAVLAWAEAHGHVTRNVAGEAIAGALPSMPSVKQHFRALPHPDVADALVTISDSKASIAAKACLRFVVLTPVVPVRPDWQRGMRSTWMLVSGASLPSA